MPMQKNRRQFWRAHFHSPVQLAAHGHVAEAELYDISLKGALIKVPEGWTGKSGEHCQLRLRLSSDATISMSCVVAHYSGRRLGLHCDNIDLDSVTHRAPAGRTQLGRPRPPRPRTLRAAVRSRGVEPTAPSGSRRRRAGAAILRAASPW